MGFREFLRVLVEPVRCGFTLKEELYVQAVRGARRRAGDAEPVKRL